MPKGVYERTPRTHDEKLASLKRRLGKMTKVTDPKLCWLFEGYTDSLGYGAIAYDKKIRLKAHRAAYIVMVGEIPAKMHILHKCDVRNCVNPAHLWVGTHTDNMRDRNKKGRANLPTGDNHWRSCGKKKV